MNPILIDGGCLIYKINDVPAYTLPGLQTGNPVFCPLLLSSKSYPKQRIVHKFYLDLNGRTK
jgi:hypothetical protein